MSKRSGLVILPISVIILALLQGCAYTIPVKQDSIMFQQKTEKLPLNARLFLSDEARNYIISEQVNIASLKFQIGEALEPNAVESLGKVFQNLSIIENKNNVSPHIDRIIVLNFVPT